MWNEELKKSANLYAKEMDALFCALNKEEFNRVSIARSVNQIWQIVQVTHKGTNKVKESKISILIHRFELFKMKENETISEMVTRFTDITNSLASLGRTTPKSKEFARSFLHSHQNGRRRQPLLKKPKISQLCR